MGDVGIRNLFRRFMKRLRPGGLLILEPQEWKSYKKKRFLTSEIREVVRTIEIRPSDFDVYLCGLGFAQVGVIQPPENAPACFRRTVYVYKLRDVAKVGAEVGEVAVDTGRHHKDVHKTNGKRVP